MSPIINNRINKSKNFKDRFGKQDISLIQLLNQSLKGAYIKLKHNIFSTADLTWFLK